MSPFKAAYEKALAEIFKKNKPYFAEDDSSWPKEGRLDYYGFEVTKVLENGSLVEVSWVFKKGEKYCCEESGCHTVLSLKKGSEKALRDCLSKWKQLRSFLPDLGKDKIILRVTHILESGCQLAGIPGLLNEETVITERKHRYIWREPLEHEIKDLIGSSIVDLDRT